MEQLKLFAVVGVTTPPVELNSDTEKQVYTGNLPVPLPPHLLIFSQGQWPAQKSSVTLDIFLDSENIGKMREETKCFTWDTSSLTGQEDGKKYVLEARVLGLEPSPRKAKKARTGKKFASKKKSGKFSPPQTHKQVTEEDKVLICDNSSEETTTIGSNKTSRITETENENQSNPPTSEKMKQKKTLQESVDKTSPPTVERGKPKRKKNSLTASAKADVPDRKKISHTAPEVRKTKQTQLNFASFKTASAPDVTGPSTKHLDEKGKEKVDADATFKTASAPDVTGPSTKNLDEKGKEKVDADATFKTASAPDVTGPSTKNLDEKGKEKVGADATFKTASAPDVTGPSTKNLDEKGKEKVDADATFKTASAPDVTGPSTKNLDEKGKEKVDADATFKTASAPDVTGPSTKNLDEKGKEKVGADATFKTASAPDVTGPSTKNLDEKGKEKVDADATFKTASAPDVTGPSTKNLDEKGKEKVGADATFKTASAPDVTGPSTKNLDEKGKEKVGADATSITHCVKENSKSESTKSEEIGMQGKEKLIFKSVDTDNDGGEKENRKSEPHKSEDMRKKGKERLILESSITDSRRGKRKSNKSEESEISTVLECEDDDSQCEAQLLNETTPQTADMHSPLPRRPAKSKRLRSDDINKTPEGPTPKKRGTRMRALTGEGGTPKSSRIKTALVDSSFGENVVGKPQNIGLAKHSEGRMAHCVDLSARVPCPSARWGHTVVLTQSRCAVLIGGQGDKQQLSKDSVWTLNTETRKWQSQDVRSEGQKPEYRMGHTATYDPTMRSVYIFGGSKNTRWFHDVHIYDLDEKKWTLAKVNGKAPTRAYHTATLHRHELWIFGGVYPRPDPNPDGCSNDIHIFSPVMKTWYQPLIQGEKPLPRSGHSATLIKDQMVMFGGWDAPYCYNDLFILDMTTVDWSTPEVKGSPPRPRSWHASCALSGSRIFIHGGYDGDEALDDSFIFDVGVLSWSRLVLPSAPKARAGHAGLCLPYSHDNQEEDEVLIFGGGDNDGEFFDDLFSFSIPFNPVVEVE